MVIQLNTFAIQVVSSMLQDFTFCLKNVIRMAGIATKVLRTLFFLLSVKTLYF